VFTGNTPRPDPAAAARVRGWAEDALARAAGLVVGVTQLACREEGCPPLETCISLHRDGRPSVAVTIHAAVSELHEADVVHAVRKAVAAG
jgi:hypothetical protein